MLTELVPILRCPVCQTNSTLALRIEARVGEFVDRGELRCDACGLATQISGGIWNAIPRGWHPPTMAQWSNVLPPTPQLYERVWRTRSLSLLSGREFSLSEERRELLGGVGILGATSVAVDVGCSEGLYARSLIDNGCGIVLAIDHSRPFLERVVKRRSSRRIVPIRALAQNLPIKEGALDAVVIGGSLNEIGDQAMALFEMGRVCKPGSPLFNMSLVAAQSKWGARLQRILRKPGITFPTALETQQMAEEASFEMTDVAIDRVVLRLTGRRKD